MIKQTEFDPQEYERAFRGRTIDTTLGMLRPAGISVEHMKADLARQWIAEERPRSWFKKLKLAIALALLAVGCSGASEQSAVVEAGATATSGNPAAGAPSEIPGSTDAIGGGPSAGGGQALSGGSGGASNPLPATAGAAQLGGSGGTEAGSPSNGGSAGAAAGAGGSAATCTAKSFDAACAGLSCGKAADGCGGEYQCGSCPTGKECSAGVCAATCGSLGFECGEQSAFGLDCGSCPDGQQCGAVSVGHCSTCAEINNVGVCPAAYPHLWTACGSAPTAECRKPFGQDPSWWCCP